MVLDTANKPRVRAVPLALLGQLEGLGRVFTKTGSVLSRQRSTIMHATVTAVVTEACAATAVRRSTDATPLPRPLAAVPEPRVSRKSIAPAVVQRKAVGPGVASVADKVTVEAAPRIAACVVATLLSLPVARRFADLAPTVEPVLLVHPVPAAALEAVRHKPLPRLKSPVVVGPPLVGVSNATPRRADSGRHGHQPKTSSPAGATDKPRLDEATTAVWNGRALRRSAVILAALAVEQ